MTMRVTDYSAVDAVLETLLRRVRSILGRQFVGLYLTGSLVMDDFNPRRSDVDFVVVTEGDLSGEMVESLRTMHDELATEGGHWAAELEGSYIPSRALRRYDPADACHPHVERYGRLSVQQHDSDWIILRHVLRQWGVALAGPPPATLIDPVSPDELRRAAQETLNDWWAPMLDDPTRLEHDGYRTYAIWTMCRILYTLQRGEVVSKTAAARWAQSEFDEAWRALIDQALAWPEGETGQLDEVQSLIRFTLQECNAQTWEADDAGL